MLRLVLRAHEDVVKIAEHEVVSLGDLVDEPLKSLAGVAKAKTHEGEFEEARRCYDGRIGYVRLVYRYLGISLYHVNDGEDCASTKAVGAVVYVLRRVSVRDRPGIEVTVVPAGAP